MIVIVPFLALAVSWLLDRRRDGKLEWTEDELLCLINMSDAAFYLDLYPGYSRPAAETKSQTMFESREKAVGHVRFMLDRLASLTFPLVVYRGLALGPNNVVNLDPLRVGQSWSVDENVARLFASGELGWDGYMGDNPGPSVLLSGVIEKPEDVDWEQTIRMWLRYTFEDDGEHEIVPVDGRVRAITSRDLG